MDDWEVAPRLAVATALKAQEQGVARLKKGSAQLHADACRVIGQAREVTALLMREGLIAPVP